jgi:asparagine synthase (glutamine-hydrolysing)
VPGAIRAATIAARWLRHFGWAGRLRRAARLLALPLSDAYRGPSRAFDLHLSPWGRNEAVVDTLLPAWTRASRAATPLGAMLAFDQQVWLPDDILLKSDRTTMAHALELRPPLLDHLLVDEVAGWPDAWKLAGGENKRILRWAAEGVVPREILDRPKVGFATPSGAWLRGALADLVQSRVVGPRSLAWATGDLRLVHVIIAQHRAGRDRTSELWPLLALELWRQDVLPAVPLVPAEREPETADVSTTGAACSRPPHRAEPDGPPPELPE